MKNFFSILILSLILINIFVNEETVYAATEEPTIDAQAAVLIDANTGQVLYDKNMNEKMYPASTTKIITSILALENLDLSKTMVIDEDTPYTEGARIYLLEGEEILTEQVLKAMLIESANDAAVALAKEVAGNIPDFAKMMNKRAKELGAKNSNFVNPNGLYEDEHVSTAYDLAMIAKYAMQNKVFREIVLTYRYIIPATNKQDTRYLYNPNRLIYDEITKVNVNGTIRPAKYDGATGIKTGYTPEAGGCLVSSAKRGDTELISVVLHSTNRFGDSIALLDYGFGNYKSTKAMEKGTALGEVKVKKGADSKVDVVLAQDAYVTIPIEASEKIVNKKIILDEKVTAPISKGQKVGIVEIYEGDKLVGKADAVANSKVPEGRILSNIGISDALAKKIFFILQAIFLIFIILLIAYVSIKRRRLKIKKQKRAELIEKTRLKKENAWKEWSMEYDKRENPFNKYNKLDNFK
ncbi:D-alanyl-D-alanine carboxypeptidase family protein [Anaerovorax odorimutans]|uniref:D-alanyl-D-alanine carboxypeptidase family protein n=1 Tax=Anaerovorax odorimutans TaxID=109327 RepID=UPI0003F5264A|nr:D-alanyl-D-alanine carboxypeptidase family protein [Anaerovorax odorimutans]